MADNWLDENVSLEKEPEPAPENWLDEQVSTGAPAAPGPSSDTPAAPPQPEAPKAPAPGPASEGPAFDSEPSPLPTWAIAAVAGILVLAVLLGGRRGER